jgi:hypothetical protein
MRSIGWGVVVALFFSSAATAGVLLYSVGPDGYSIPDRLFSFSSSDNTHETWVWDLGNGSLGFNGGLTYRAANGSLYAVANDYLGNGELVNFGLDGRGLTSILALTSGVGWYGGLSAGPADNVFYAIGTAWDTGVPAIYQINPASSAVNRLFNVGDGALGFNGGLTYDSKDGLFYAIAADGSGASFLYSIDTGTSSVTPITAVTLGTGYTGGIAYDANDVFFAIQNDSDGYSSLQKITLGTDPSVSNVYGFSWPDNWGYWNAGLTFGPENGPQPIPEPATGLLVGLTLAGARLARFLIRPHSKQKSIL